MRFEAALVASALALSATPAGRARAQLLPAGKFKSRDGRPGPGKYWQVSDAQGAALAAELSAIAAKTPISIDYEHQTLLAATNGQPAPAAGWMTGFEWPAGEGLFAKVDWTPRALAYFDADEYRYISPVILYDALGNVTGLHNAALVSTPALLGMDAVQAALAASFKEFLPHQPTTTESNMELVTLIALLGLAAGASAQDVTAAITSLTTRPLVPAALAAQLGLPGTADEAAVLAALTKKLGMPDAASMGVITALQAQLAALSAQVNDRTVTEAVDAAIAAHKLVPAQRDWARKLGRADIAQLNAFVASAPAIAGLAGQTHGRQEPAPGNADVLSPVQAMLALRMGLDAKAYLARINLPAAA